jgi:hypothetical protein
MMVQARTTELHEMKERVQRLQGAIGSRVDTAEAKAAAAAAASDARAAAAEEARVRAEEETNVAREQLRAVEAAAAEAQKGFAAWRAKARTMMEDKEGEVTALQVRCDLMIPVLMHKNHCYTVAEFSFLRLSYTPPRSRRDRPRPSAVAMDTEPPQLIRECATTVPGTGAAATRRRRRRQ